MFRRKVAPICAVKLEQQRSDDNEENPMSRKFARDVIAALSVSCATLCALAQPLPTAKPEQVGMSAQRLSRIEPLLKQEIDAGRLPGAVVMIARKGKLVYSEAIGFQDKAAGTPMKTDAV